MSILEGFFLGLIQGITEFLPVSSSGHLVLFQNIFKTQGDALFFNVMVHLATLVAVAVVFWKDIVAILRHPIQKLTGTLLVATIPAVLAGLLLKDFFEGAFEGQYLAFGFLLTAVILTVSELVSRRTRNKQKQVTYPQCIAMGLFQAVAILPGISRSGSTIAGGLLSGVDRNQAARFSFLMSIPVILGSVVLEGYDVVKAGALEIPILPTIVGMIAAGVSGFFAIRFMLNLVRRKKLYGFAIYVAALGILVLLDQLVFHVVFANPFMA